MNSWLKIFCDLHGVDERVAMTAPFGQVPHSINSVSDQEFDGTIKVIRIARRYGRFGNNFYQLLNSLIIARRLGCTELQIPPITGISLPLSIEGIKVTGFPTDADVKPALAGSFFAPIGLERFLGDFGSRFAFDTVCRYVRPLFGELLAGIKSLGRNVIAMHFRGGDVFAKSGFVHPWYVQPPASYYIKAFEFAECRLGVDSACLVFEDRSNPAIEIVEKELTGRNVPCILQSGDVLADLRCLLGAHHIVRSHGTFCEAVGVLSEYCETFIGFRRFSSQHDMEAFPQSKVEELLRQKGARTVLIVDTDEQYIPPKGWNASDEQLQIVRTFSKNLLEVKDIHPAPYWDSAIGPMPSGSRTSKVIPDALDCLLISAKRHQEAVRLEGMFDHKRRSLWALASDYENYVFATLPDTICAFQSRINRAALDCGLLSSPEATAFLEMGELSPDIHGALFPSREYPYFNRLESPRREEFVVFPESPNEFFDELLPPYINMVSHRRVRPGFSIFGMTGGTLYAQANGYQLHDGKGEWYIHWASSRAHSRRILEFPSIKTDKELVIVQDRFWGTGFNHFLYDWITRIHYFCQSGIADHRNCVFILGGAPTEFHDLVLSSVGRIHGLQRENFHFPSAEQNIVSSGRTFWFGDQHTFMHPAQMVHPQSIAAIRQVVAGISAPASVWPYVFVSRGDAGTRRLKNEEQLLSKLEALGFKSVSLGDLPVLDQIGILRGAKCVVAPHGMGLSNIISNQGPLRVVELHSPFGGTDAYALISRAMGFSYDYVLGFPEDAKTGDFSVRWEDLEPKLLPWIGGAQLQCSRGMAPTITVNLVPSSATFTVGWHGGTQHVPAIVTTANEVRPYLEGNAVVLHRLDGMGRTPDANAGFFMIPPLEASTIYTASCWVWIPENFLGDEVKLCVGEWDGQTWVRADLSQRACWQRISSRVKSPETMRTCNVVLRAHSVVPCELFSTCWLLERGAFPTGYVPTAQTPAAT